MWSSSKKAVHVPWAVVCSAAGLPQPQVVPISWQILLHLTRPARQTPALKQKRLGESAALQLPLTNARTHRVLFDNRAKCSKHAYAAVHEPSLWIVFGIKGWLTL